jgi:hypothetical protein
MTDSFYKAPPGNQPKRDQRTGQLVAAPCVNCGYQYRHHRSDVIGGDMIVMRCPIMGLDNPAGAGESVEAARG